MKAAARIRKHFIKRKARKLRKARAAIVERDDPGYPPAVLRWMREEAARKATAAGAATGVAG